MVSAVQPSLPIKLLLSLVTAVLVLGSSAFAAVPVAPSGMAVSHTIINSSARFWRFTWTDNSTDEDGFKIYLRVFNGQSYETSLFVDVPNAGDRASRKAGTGVRSEYFELNSAFATYQANGLTFGYGIAFHVVAYKSSGEASTASNLVDMGNAPVPQAPTLGAPSSFTMTPAKDGSFPLKFTDNATGEYYFQVQYKRSGTSDAWTGFNIDFNENNFEFTNYEVIQGNGTDGVANTADDLYGYIPTFKPSTAYDFQIRAADFFGNFTTWTSTSATTAALKAPTNLTATRVGEAGITLSFANNSTGESGYEIEYREAGTTTWYLFNRYDNPFFNVVPAFQGVPATNYEFRTRAFLRTTTNPADTPTVYTDYSNTASVSTNFTAPTSLTVTPSGEGKVNLAWLDNSSVESGYLVQFRNKGATTWTNSSVTAANATSLANQVIAPGATIEVRICALYSLGENAGSVPSGFSNIAEVTTTFTAPTNLTATASTTQRDRISFAWTDNSGVETDYELQYRKAGETTFTTRKFVAGNSATGPNSMTLTDLPGFDAGTVYQFQIRAVYAGADGSIISGSAFTSIASTATLDGFTSKPFAPITMGTPFTYTLVTTSQQPRTSWTVGTLPDGLSFDSATGKITGTPTVAGLYVVPLTATFSGGVSHTMNLNLRILRPKASPQIAATIGEQVLTPSGVKSVALNTKFADPDTESAVRMQTSKGALDIILYPSLTPATVANFLSYSYNDTVFHRAPPGFVIQGGGYRSYATPDVFTSVTKQAPVINEPGISNVAATVAMAKTGDDPNSATSEFFFSLSDNSSNLDNQNGGFTAFGRLADSTMTTLSSLASAPTANYAVKVRQNDTTPTAANAYWESCPVDATTAPTTMDQTKLMKVNTVTTIPVLTYSITSAPDASVATASIVGTELQISAVALGSTSLVVAARDVDGNVTSQTVPIVVGTPTATVTLSALNQTYNGSARVVTATTTPAGLAVNITYEGSTTAPTNAGSYAVVATVNDGTYTGSASGTLVVAKAAATFTLNGLTQTYDGTPKAVSATTSPPSLAMSYTYAGAPAAPSAHGTYAVVATMTDQNYTAPAQNATLTIQGQPATEWRTQNFTPQQISAGLAADTADADGDGMSNLAEYALGTNPTATNAGLPPAVKDANGLTLTFTRPKDLPGVVYAAESSDNMVTWNPLTLEVVNDGPVQTIRVRDPVNTGDLSRRFIRLKFSTPPAN